MSTTILQVNFVNETLITKDTKIGSTSNEEVHIFMLQSVSLSRRYVDSCFESIKVKFKVCPADTVWVVSMTYADRSKILHIFHKDDLHLALQLRANIMMQDPRSFDEMYTRPTNEGHIDFYETKDSFISLKDPRASDELYNCRSGYTQVEVRIDPIMVGI